MFVRSLVVAAALSLAAGAAQASLFSFASDSNSDGWTFTGTAGASSAFVVNSGVTSSLTLYTDDNNGPLPSIAINALMQASLTAHLISATPIGGGVYLYSYSVDGTVDFVNPLNTSDKYLTITVGNLNQGQNSASMLVAGGPNQWSSTGSIFGSSGLAGVTYTATQDFVSLIQTQAALVGSSAAAYGISAGSISTNTDFSFDLTVINTGDSGVNTGPAVALDGGLPTQAWRSEGSFSGSANIPAPAGAGLLGLSGLIAIRRRRA